MTRRTSSDRPTDAVRESVCANRTADNTPIDGNYPNAGISDWEDPVNNGDGGPNNQMVTAADVARMLRQFSRQLAALAPGPHASDEPSLSPVLLAEGRTAEELVLDLVRIVSQAEGYAALVVSLLDQDKWWQRFGSRDCVGFLADHLRLPYGQAKRLAELGEGLRNHLPQTAAALCTGQISTHHAQSLCQSMTASRQLVDSLTQPPTEDDAAGAGSPAGPDLLDELTQPSGAGPESEPATGTPAGLPAPNAPENDQGADGDHSVFGAVLNGEQALLAKAVAAKPKVFRDAVKAHAQQIDPAACERDYANRRAAQSLEILSHHKGGYLINGYLDEEAGQMLKLVLGALRKQLPRETRVGSSINHQHALALGMLARLDLEQVLTTTKNGSSLHLNVAVDLETFTRAATAAGVPADQLPASGDYAPARWVDTRGPIPDSALERMACDSKVARIIFGPASQILNAGDEVRIATAAQRRAVMARDTQCVFPSCTAPPGICEVHHVDEWVTDGGPTNIDNLALLCWNHHHHIHQHRLKLTRNNGTEWKALRRDTNPRRC